MTSESSGHPICTQCAYDLQGLSPDARCPECGRPVADSLQGDLLRFASSEYLRKLKRGSELYLTLQIAGFAFVLFGGVVAGVIASPMASGVVNFLHTLCQISAGVGMFLLTTADPARIATEPPGNSRRLARWSIGLCVVLQIIFLAFDPTNPQGTAFNLTFGGPSSARSLLGTAMPVQVFLISAKVLQLVATLIGFFSSLVYTAWLFRRVPDIESMKTCLRYRWLLPLISVTGLCICIGLGPMIASCMYLNQLWKLRGYLIQAIESQERGSEWPLAS